MAADSSTRTPLPDFLAETSASIAARLDAVRAAQTQTRLTLIAMAVVSAMMLITSYNAYFSYDYVFITDKTEFARSTDQTKVPQTLLNEALRDWANARTIQVPLLGIRVSVDDAAVLGTGVLALLSVWLVLAAR